MPLAPTKPFHTHPHIRFSYPSLLLFSHTLYSAESVFHIHPHIRLSLITSSHPFHHAHKPIFSLYPFIHLTIIPPPIPHHIFSLHLWLHLIHDITCPSCSYPSVTPCITHLLTIFSHVWGPIILPKSRGIPKHCKISNQGCAFKGDTRWQFDDEEADLWGFLGFCLYENVSYGYGFRDEASHYASCREDLRNLGFMPLCKIYSHGNGKRGSPRRGENWRWSWFVMTVQP